MCTQKAKQMQIQHRTERQTEKRNDRNTQLMQITENTIRQTKKWAGVFVCVCARFWKRKNMVFAAMKTITKSTKIDHNLNCTGARNEYINQKTSLIHKISFGDHFHNVCGRERGADTLHHPQRTFRWAT